MTFLFWQKENLPKVKQLKQNKIYKMKTEELLAPPQVQLFFSNIAVLNQN